MQQVRYFEPCPTNRTKLHAFVQQHFLLPVYSQVSKKKALRTYPQRLCYLHFNLAKNIFFCQGALLHNFTLYLLQQHKIHFFS